MDELNCTKCLRILKRTEFHESTNRRQAACWCRKCRKNALIAKKGKCDGKHKKLDKHGRCRKCDKAQGLKYCHKCQTLFLIYMAEVELGEGKSYFRGRRTECRKCEVSCRQTRQALERNPSV